MFSCKGIVPCERYEESMPELWIYVYEGSVMYV